MPAELTSFTFDRPQHTPNLWVAEGWTAYYDDLLPTRAELHGPRTYLDVLRDDMVWVQRAPGARRQSVVEASWHAWTGLYVRDENSVNAGTNYYTHGAVLAACLDLLIRETAPDSDGLDDGLPVAVAPLRARRAPRLPHAAATPRRTSPRRCRRPPARTSATSSPTTSTGTEPPPLPELLDVVGLTVTEKDAEMVRPDLGVQTRDDGDGVVVQAVYRDRPAWRAGISGGDRLVALDGTTVGRGELEQVLALARPGETVTATVTRGARLLDLEVELGDPLPEQRIVPVEQPDEAQRTAFARWLGHDLDDVE